MLLATLHTGVATSACTCAQANTAPSLHPRVSAPQVSTNAALVAAVRQRSNTTGDCRWSASAPTNKGEMKAATAVV